MMNSRLQMVLTVTLVVIGVSLVAADLGAQHKVAFATSVQGNGNLGDPGQWPDNGGLSGLDAADKVCQNRALAAGLANHTDFIAWMSNSSDDAYCRVHDLSGLKSADCGLATLPVWAGPWVRTNGSHFAATIDLALDPTGQIFHPVLFDEFGVEVGAYTAIFTGTESDGVYAPGLDGCGGWSNGVSGHVVLGHVRGTTVRWTGGATGACADSRSLLCLEAGGAGPDLPPAVANGAQVFVTSVAGTADLGGWPEAGGASGIDAGDAICRTLAGNAGLFAPLSYMAMLSNNSVDARDRFTTDGPWVRLDGVLVSRMTELFNDSVIESSIGFMETGSYISDRVFTGTSYLGDGVPENCGDWSNGSTGDAMAGSSAMTQSGWTVGLRSCAGPARLYCFSDTDTWHIFSDGFESGNTDGWDGTSP